MWVIFVLFTHDGFYVTSCIGLFLFLFSPDGNQLDVYYQGEKKIKEKKIKQAENAYVILTHRES